MQNHAELARLCEQGYDEKTLHLRGDIECWITEHEGSTVVIPRGTEATSFWSNGGWMDIIRDIRFVPWYDRRAGWCHAGFLKAAQKIADAIGEYHLTGPMIIAGHSLGAGIAAPLAMILKALGHDVREVVLFGSPRPFKKSAAKRFNIPCVSYRNRHDFVTTVPRRSWGYRHPVEVTQLGEFHEKRTWDDHKIPLYVEALSNASSHSPAS